MRYLVLAAALLGVSGAHAACPAGAINVAVGSSIQAAVNAAPTGAKFCIAAGIHRMQAIAPKNGQQFYGVTAATSILNGSRLLTTFTRDGALWVASGQTQQGTIRGECTSGTMCARPEALFIANVPMTQVSTKASVTAGKFYFDYAADKIYFANDPTGKTVEATVTPFAFSPTGDSVRIEALTVEKYQSPAQEGAIQGEEATGWNVRLNTIWRNSGAGVSVGTNGQIVGNKIHSNGQLGLTAGGNNILIQSNNIAYNNTNGFDMYWEAGGAKVTESDGVTFRNNQSHHNVGAGLWTDEDVYNAIYEGNTVYDNQDAGIFHEISYNVIIRNNVLARNGLVNKGWFWGADIQLASVQDAQIYGNTITTRAGGTAIILIDQNREPDEFGGYYKTQNNSVHDNDITCLGDCSLGGASDSDPGDENYDIIETGGNSFDFDTIRRPVASAVEYAWGHAEYTFAGFRGVGNEANGQEITY
jgi:parallel beta-helix repeat protein